MPECEDQDGPYYAEEAQVLRHVQHHTNELPVHARIRWEGRDANLQILGPKACPRPRVSTAAAC
jgi:hypothetical protein